MSQPKSMGYNMSLIDLYDLSLEQRTGSYILHEKEITVIETSASPSIPHLLKGLEQLDIGLDEVKHIIVTHIHLDHAGGVGLLLEKCPNAYVYVHPRGQRHLADPSRLIQGAKAVYGDSFDHLFDPIVPVPEDRIITKNDGETLKVGENRTLTFFDTPGHAKHHFSIYDSLSNGIFTGDTLGILYPPTETHDFELVLPSTSPNQFDPEDMLLSLDRVEDLGVDSIFFGHYGKAQNPESVYEQIKFWLPKFVEIGEKEYDLTANLPFEEKAKSVEAKLYQMISEFLEEKGVPSSDHVHQHIKVDLAICAQGIVDYLQKKQVS
ncbi:MBL fold metallo-hydrolase [Aquibacillus koreensis]|uniref:MBL fold metallo-hydrolase n=1 Tax=Aquibacillus koreensis TaxID=279446 RepID=A0A9X4AJ84_9BACI|nr:MBL fold metallo-hydrolase [Aquibacillus koreensis]MCT2536912.1 MBL fold metallo-hydrolase [Aquibacillus koreensis]MDC3421957.1 MBL fold metallo-hydrolase [Aquibacillus koreensis]